MSQGCVGRMFRATEAVSKTWMEDTIDYPSMSESATPLGTIKLEDGVQSWIGPRQPYLKRAEKREKWFCLLGTDNFCLTRN